MLKSIICEVHDGSYDLPSPRLRFLESMAIVVLMLEWPNALDTVAASTPACIRTVALKCRSEWISQKRKPWCSVKLLCHLYGCPLKTGFPSSVTNTRSLSIHLVPYSRWLCSCQVLSFLNSSNTTSGSLREHVDLCWSVSDTNRRVSLLLP